MHMRLHTQTHTHKIPYDRDCETVLAVTSTDRVPALASSDRLTQESKLLDDE